MLTESIAICRYFDALHPKPVLFGEPGKEAAVVEMWNRRLELHLLFPVSQVFRHLHPALKTLEVPQVPDWGEANKPRVADFLAVFDRQLSEASVRGRRPLHSRRYHRARGRRSDEAGKDRRAEEMKNVRRWYDEISKRPSSAA